MKDNDSIKKDYKICTFMAAKVIYSCYKFEFL